MLTEKDSLAGCSHDHSISNVLLVESLNFNLLSVAQLCDLGFCCNFTIEDVIISSVDGSNLKFKGFRHENLYLVDFSPYFRKNNHHKMTFAMSYNASEHYILVLSHDEVVHLKCSMPVSYTHLLHDSAKGSGAISDPAGCGKDQGWSAFREN